MNTLILILSSGLPKRIYLVFKRYFFSNSGSIEDSEIYSGVEKCSCPSGYSGLSCESCSYGYVRIMANTSDHQLQVS